MKNKKQALITALSVVLMPAMVGHCRKDESVQSTIEETRYARFSKDINLPFWFWLNEGELEPLEERFTDDDLKLMKKLGLTFVRVPVDVVIFLSAGRALRAAFRLPQMGSR